MGIINKNSQKYQENLNKQQLLKLAGYNVPQDGSWGPYQQKLWDQLGYKQLEFNTDIRSEGQKFWQPVHNYFAEATHKIKNPEEGPLMGKHTLPAIGVAAGLGLAGSGAATTLAGMKAAAGFSTRKALGDTFMGMLAGTAANEGVSAATGKTIGQNIASATNDYVPAFVGEFANPFYATGWWSKPVGNFIKGSADFANATKVYLSNLTGLSKVKSPKNLPQINFKIDRNSEYYKNLVNQFGDLQANRIVQRLESPEFKKYFLAGNEDQALKEIYDYSLARSVDNKIRGIPDEGGGVLTGSSAIATEGTIHRKSAVPHDLDYIMYTKSPKKDVYQGTKEETKEALQELFGNYRESILQSPGMLKFRQQFGLEDAPVFNIPRWLPKWFVPRDKTGAIYLTPMFNVGEAGVNRTVQSTVDGIPIDLFFTGNHIPTGPIKGVSAASTPLSWKKQWSKTPSKRNNKDITDLQDYKPYSSDNPIINTETGESQYAPFYFGDDLISAEGYPSINMIELYPGASQQVPATMNWKGNFKVMPNKDTRRGYMLASLMEGSPVEKQVSKSGTININNLLAIINKGSKVEQDVINKVLNEKFAGQKNIDFYELKSAVQDELITYSKRPQTKYSAYGMDRLGYATGPDFNELTSTEIPGIKLQTFSFESPRIPKGSAAHYDSSTLGHSRTYTTSEEPNVLHVLESQSDWAQATSTSTMDEEILRHARYKLNQLENLLLKTQQKTYKDDLITEDLLLKLIEKEKKLIKSKTEFKKAFSSQEQHLRDNYTLRQLQENIKHAAYNGYTKMRYPTPETAAKIEGYSKVRTAGEKYQEIANQNDMINAQLRILGEYNVPAPKFRTSGGGTYKYDISTGLTDIKVDPQGNVSRVPVGEGIDYHIIENVPEIGSTVYNLPKVFPDQDEILYEQLLKRLRDKKDHLFGQLKHVEYTGPEQYSPGHQTILKKYADFPKMFNKLFKGQEVRTVTDPKGNTWYEVDIPENYLQQEWKFKRGGNIKKIKNLKLNEKQ